MFCYGNGAILHHNFYSHVRIIVILDMDKNKIIYWFVNRQEIVDIYCELFTRMKLKFYVTLWVYGSVAG